MSTIIRLLGLVITLLLVGYLITTQLQATSRNAAHESALHAESESGVDSPPRVPTSPEDVRAFKDDVNSYINQQTENRTQEIEESLDN